jgi:two-component system sensor histidine kinase MprB
VSIRRRIALASATAVAVAILLASLLTYLLTADQLHGQLDSQLESRGRAALTAARYLEHTATRPPSSGARGRGLLGLEELDAIDSGKQLPGLTLQPGELFGRSGPGPGQARGYEQLVDAQGHVMQPSGQSLALPVDPSTRVLAARGGAPYLSDVRIGGTSLRMLTVSLGHGRVIQLAEPVAEVDRLLSHLRLILILVGLSGIAIAALLGRLVAGTALLPLRRLTEASEHIARTRDLSSRMEPVRGDELGRLAASFNAMLDALEGSMRALDASVGAQRQLVADASHELRTPVTSVRTNIEILQQQGAQMDADEQRRLLDEVVEQIEELTMLVNDLIELARGEEPHPEQEELRLDLLVAEVVERVHRRAPDTPIEVELEPTILAGVPARLERAIGNLVDNALKYGPPGAPVTVRLADGELTVRDRGPGIAPADLPHVFDRFYRGAEARSQSGSGLGLAIVKQVAEQHNGSVVAETPPGGGVLMRLRLPGSEPTSDAAGAVEEPLAPPAAEPLIG